MDPTSTQRIDVLIVGAGPVGLFLANECARRGLRWRLVESHPSQSEHSKALAVFPRTMEIFDMAGIVAPFLQAANRVTSVAVMAHDHELARLRFAPDDTPYSFVAMVPQNVTENLLVQELHRRGGSVEYNTTFVSAEQRDDYARATLTHDGSSAELETSFIVGCDGAHSTVRHLLGLPLEGAEYTPSFLLADIETNSMPAEEMLLCPSEFGPVAIFPMSATRLRVVATVEHADDQEPSLDLVRQILAQRAPAGINPLALHWSSYFRIHHRHAAQLAVGRIFIAGDAAHIHSPFGGQGMNTGLHDIWNLVWKLELSLRGHGNRALLDSYSAERLPVIKNVIETTDHLTKVMGTPHKLAQVLRDAIIPMVSHIAPFQHAFVRRLSELGIAYRGSPIIEGPGERYFDDSIRGGGGIGSRFLLLTGQKQGVATEAAAAALCRPLSEVVEHRTVSRPGITLVRPDGYVAYSSQSGDAVAALQSMRSLLERQTTPEQHQRVAGS